MNTMSDATTSSSQLSKPRIICAAIRNESGDIICGPRHFDPTMRHTIKMLGDGASEWWKGAEQGFVDQHGTFYNRVEARKIAAENGQIVKLVGGDSKELFSENLY